MKDRRFEKKIEISERWFSDVYLTRVFKCWLCKIPVIYFRLVSISKMYIIEQSILVQKIIADGCIVNVVIRYALNWFIGNIAYFCWKCWFSEICHNTIDLRNFLFGNYLSPPSYPLRHILNSLSFRQIFSSRPTKAHLGWKTNNDYIFLSRSDKTLKIELVIICKNALALVYSFFLSPSHSYPV